MKTATMLARAAGTLLQCACGVAAVAAAACSAREAASNPAPGIPEALRRAAIATRSDRHGRIAGVAPATRLGDGAQGGLLGPVGNAEPDHVDDDLSRVSSLRGRDRIAPAGLDPVRDYIHYASWTGLR